MRLALALLLWGVLQAKAGAAAGEPATHLRCGWFENPTPNNAWLVDQEGAWLLSIQGGHQADGDWPQFSPSQWRRTNQHYGYGCACLQLQANPQTREVSRIVSARARPLSACRKNRGLTEPAG